MYTDPEEARSDFVLAAAAYLFGPLLVSLVTGLVVDVPVLGQVWLLLAPLLVTLLVPYLLARYRGDPAAAYGLAAPLASGLATGALIGLPVALAAVLPLIVLLGGADAPSALGASLLSPAVRTLARALVVGGDLALDPLALAVNIVRWVGELGLVLYLTVKARDAFRATYRTVPQGVGEIGRWVAIAGAVVAALLALSTLDLFLVLLVALIPLGVAGGVVLLLRRLGDPGSTTRMALIAPLVLLAVRRVELLGLLGGRADPLELLLGFWSAAVVAGLALAVSAHLEARRSAWGAAGLALVLGIALLGI